jgi:hypothetical protein
MLLIRCPLATFEQKILFFVNVIAFFNKYTKRVIQDWHHTILALDEEKIGNRIPG